MTREQLLERCREVRKILPPNHPSFYPLHLTFIAAEVIGACLLEIAAAIREQRTKANTGPL